VVGGVGGSIPTAGAAGAESIGSSRKESDKSSRASGAGTIQGRGVGRKGALGICVRGDGGGAGGQDYQGGSHKAEVVKGVHTAKMVEGGRKEKHVLVNKRLDD
jgi:hypothetical protein